MNLWVALLLALLLAGCGGGGGGGGSSPAGSGGSAGGGPSSPSPSPSPSPSGSTVRTFLSGQAFPVAMAFAPDGRLFFNELRTGRVRVVGADGTLRATPFATETVETSGERGLLGLALDPAFASNGFVYLYFSDPAGAHRLVRYTASGDLGTNRTLLRGDFPTNSIHNGGNMAFGPDGRLYLSLGDAGDPANSQNPNALPGRILRLAADGTVPADNPLGAGNPTFAMGLRNSFDLAFHPSGSLYASENGPNCDDEINRIEADGNYGWRPGVPCGDTNATFDAPIVRFNPVIAPTGVAFYQGAMFPELEGWLLMTDFLGGRLRAFRVDDAAGGQVLETRILVDGGFGALLDVAPGPDGSLYLASTNAILRVTRP